MTNADPVRESGTGQGIQLPLWEQRAEEYRRRGPVFTDAQRDELRALAHQILNPSSD